MTSPPAAIKAAADPCAWIEAQGAFASDLAVFQAHRPACTSHELADVLAAIEPVHKLGFSWSIIHEPDGSCCQVMHRSGWSLTTHLIDGLCTGEALATAFGVVLADKPAAPAAVATAQSKPSAAKAEQPPAAAEEPDEFADEPDLIGPGAPENEVLPEDRQLLSDSDKATCIALIKSMKPDERQRFTVAFRSHFNVDRSVKRISDHINQVQHQLFITEFLDELELIAA
jgi:hypothetical protein